MKDESKMETKKYETTQMNLAALLLTKISLARFTTRMQEEDDRLCFVITYPEDAESDLMGCVSDFLECTATANIYQFNKKLNQLRDHLPGKRKGIRL